MDTVENQEVEQTTEQPEVEAPEVQTPKMYTKEELELIVGKTRQEELDKYKGIQRAIAKKDREIEQLRKQSQRPQSQDNDSIMEMMIQTMKKSGDYGDNESIAQLEAEIARRKQAQAHQATYARQEQIANEAREALMAKIEEAGGDPDGEEFEDVFEAWELAKSVDGRFERAEKKLTKILKSKKPAENTENEEEKRKRWIEEGRRQAMEKNGQLNAENNANSGAIKSFTRTQIDNMSPDEFAKNREQIMAAFDADKVT